MFQLHIMWKYLGIGIDVTYETLMTIQEKTGQQDANFRRLQQFRVPSQDVLHRLNLHFNSLKPSVGKLSTGKLLFLFNYLHFNKRHIPIYRFDAAFWRRIRAGSHPRSTVVHDIQQLGFSTDYLRQLDRVLAGTTFGGKIFIVAHHSDHFHIIHDCAYSQSHCRCSRVQAINQVIKRTNRRTIRVREYSPGHWRNLLAYLSAGCRQIRYLGIAGRIWIDANQTRFDPNPGYRELTETAVVAMMP